MTLDERKALTAASHIGCRNISRAKRDRMLVSIAACKCKKVGSCEIEMANALLASRLPVETQFPCGKYNIDIAVGTVAVELFTRPHERLARMRFQERFKYLVDSGYSMVYINFYWANKQEVLGQINELVRFIETSYRLPSASRKHWMVRCGTKRPSVLRDKFGKRTSIWAPKAFYYTTTEIYP